MAKVEGTETLSLTPADTWRRLNDAGALADAIPGCSGFTELAPGRFQTSIAVAVGPVRGVYDGTVEYADVEEPVSCKIVVVGRGDKGAIEGEGAISLAATEGGTEVSYTGTFKLAGPVAGVGQRLAPGISRRMIVETLRNLEQASQETHTPDAASTAADQAPSGSRSEVVLEPPAGSSPRGVSEPVRPPFRPFELAPWQIFALGLAAGTVVVAALRRRR